MSAERTTPNDKRARAATHSRVRVLMSGVIEDENMVLDVLNLLSNGKRTVGFDVIEGQVRRTLYLREGDIIAASSNLAADRLGYVVFRMGLIDERQLGGVLRLAEQGHKIGNVLVDRGLLKPPTLWRAMRVQTEEILGAMVEVREGHFQVQRFEPALLPNLNPMRTQQLILDVLRRQDELAHLRSRLPDDHSPLVTTEARWTPSEGSGRFMTRVLEKVDGARTLSELIQATGLGELQVCQVVQQMLKAGVLTVGEAPDPDADWSMELQARLSARGGVAHGRGHPVGVDVVGQPQAEQPRGAPRTAPGGAAQLPPVPPVPRLGAPRLYAGGAARPRD